MWNIFFRGKLFRKVGLIIGLILILWLCVRLVRHKPFKGDQMGIGRRQKGHRNQGHSLPAVCCYRSKVDASDQSPPRKNTGNTKPTGIKTDGENKTTRGTFEPNRNSGELNGRTSDIIRLPINGSVAETSSHHINTSAPLTVVRDNSNESLASRGLNNATETLMNRRLPRLQFGKEGYKVLHIFEQLSRGNSLQGPAPFKECLQSKCILSSSADVGGTNHINSDAILFDIANLDYARQLLKQPKQIWILNLMESPLNTPDISHLNGLINWTATYRPDSTIYTPYAEYKLNKDGESEPDQDQQDKLFLSKSKNIAWFVSNCGSKNGRLRYVQELQKFIRVDIFGLCGIFSCNPEKEHDCLEMLRKSYKFYLSFENSNCQGYISEKFWNALR